MRIAINFHKLRSAAIFVFTRMTVTFSSCWLVFVGEVSTTNEEDRWWFVFAFIWLCCRQGDFRFMRKVKGFYCPMAAKGLSHFFQKDKVKNSEFFYYIFASNNFGIRIRFRVCVYTLNRCRVFWVTHCFLKCVRNIKAVMFLLSVLDVPPEEETGDRDYALWTSQTIKGLLPSEKRKQPWVVVYFNIRAIRTAKSPILEPMLFKLIHTFSFPLGFTSFRHQFKGMCKITSRWRP